jgi:hypothetical protein
LQDGEWRLINRQSRRKMAATPPMNGENSMREISFPKSQVPDPKKRTGQFGEGRLGNEPLAARVCRLPEKLKEPTFTATGSTEAPDGGEILSAEGRTPEEAREKLWAILSEKVTSGQATSATLLKCGNFPREEIKPVDREELLKAQEQDVFNARGKFETEKFMQRHPEYCVDPRNRDLFFKYMSGSGLAWTLANLEHAFGDILNSGQYVTQEQQQQEKAQAQQVEAEKARLQAEEAAMRPRGRFSAASQPYIPTPEEVRQREVEELRQADDTIIREAEDLVSRSPDQYKRFLTHKTDWAQKLEAAHQRRNARRLGR